MTFSSWQTIANTPWWVFVIFFYLIRVGILATKARVVSIHGLFILPAIFIPLSLINIFSTMELTVLSTFFWSGSLAVGILLGCMQFRALKIKAVKDKNKLYVPGTWSLLILITLIFVVKYYFGYQTAIDPELLQDPKFAPWLLSLYGFLAGLFLGRVIWALRCMKVGPYFSEAK